MPDDKIELVDYLAPVKLHIPGPGEEAIQFAGYYTLDNVDTKKYCHAMAVADGHKWSGSVSWSSSSILGQAQFTIKLSYVGTDDRADVEDAGDLTITIKAGEEEEAGVLEVAEYQII